MKAIITKKCLFCKTLFKSENINESRTVFQERKYCSQNCAYRAQKGKAPKNLKMIHKLPRTKKWRENISKATFRQIKEKGAPHLNHKHSEATKEKMSLDKMREKNPNWDNGISFDPYPVAFNVRLKKKIRERDNFTCQECNYNEQQLGYKLSVHHIDYDKQNISLDNLISLCRSCHSQTNFQREDWKNYFNNRILV